jgi:hypothetical protein
MRRSGDGTASDVDYAWRFGPCPRHEVLRRSRRLEESGGARGRQPLRSGGPDRRPWPHGELAKDITIAEEALPRYHGFSLAYNTRSKEEVDRIFADLKRKGATIVKPPQQVFWGGYAGYFADVDGHHWEVAFNPLWTVRADGRVSMTAPT